MPPTYTYTTYDPIWEEGDPVQADYPNGYRTLVSMFASPSYHPGTIVLLVMDNEEYANSPPAVGRRSVATGEWEVDGEDDAVALIDYGDGPGEFIWTDYMPPVVWPPTSTKFYTMRYIDGPDTQVGGLGTNDDFWWVELDASFPFDFIQRSETPAERGLSDIYTHCFAISYNSDATMLVAHHRGIGIPPDVHSKWSMWSPGNGVGYFKSNSGFDGRYGTGDENDQNRTPQGFIIDKHDHLWVWTTAQTENEFNLYLDEYSWNVAAGAVTLTFLNRYELINQDGGFNTWRYTIHGATYNEDTDTIVFHWSCEFPSPTYTNRDPVAIDYGGMFNTPKQFRITFWDLDTRAKKLSDADSILITKESDGLLLTDFGNTINEPQLSGEAGFLGSEMNFTGDRFIGTWTKQNWTVFVNRNEPNPRVAVHAGFWHVILDTGVASKHDFWPEDLLDDVDTGEEPGVYTFAGAIWEPLTEKFWAGRRNQGFTGHFEGAAWYYETEGFGIYGFEPEGGVPLIGGSGMQLEPVGCIITAQVHALEVRDINSVLELGPFRFVEQKDSDETSMVTTLVIGLTECDIGLLVEVDMALLTGSVDMATLVDVLGDDIEIDMGEGVGNSDDFTLELLGNNDASTYPSAPIEFMPEVLEPIEDRGSVKQYSPMGYSFISHRVRLKATEIDEKFAVKYVDLSGQLTGRLK